MLKEKNASVVKTRSKTGRMGDLRVNIWSQQINLVGVAGLEPTTSCTPCKRASQLRYTPTVASL